MGYSVRHVIDTDVDELWRLFFDVELARAMLRELGDHASFEILEERVDETGLQHRRIECRSNVELPDFLKKLVGDGSYTEVGCFDTVQRKYSAYCVPKVGAEKFKSSFEITARPIEDGKRCERLIVVENSIKLFGLGAMLERMLEQTQREGHEQSAKFMNKWIQAQRAA
jgi:hypothetical protein